MTLFLIRHALTAATGTALSGRSPGLPLTQQGRHQAERLADNLAREGIQRIFSSPLERALQTAAPLACKLGLRVEISEALTDIDFGDWTGALIAKLEPLEKWRQWNLFRSSVRIPNGELMSEVQARMIIEVERLSREFPEEKVALVSHADPIRTVLAHFLGMPLDLLHRLEISPASVTIVDISHWGAQVLQANLTYSDAEQKTHR